MMLEKSYIFQFEVDCGVITKFNVFFSFYCRFFLNTRGVIFASHYSEMKFLFAKHVGCKDIEDSSWLRVRDHDIFALHLTGRPSDEGARSARKVQCKDILISHEETSTLFS